MNQNGRRPHIILILANQLRADVLGPFGGRQCPTPMLDTLSTHASVFLRHFTCCPLGSPARASILTGLDPHRHGAIINGAAGAGDKHCTIEPTRRLLPEMLSEAGYRVVHCGAQTLRTDPPMEQRAPDAEFLGPFSLAEHLKHLEERGLMVGDLKELRDPIIDYIDGKPVILGGMSARIASFPLREDLFYDSLITTNAVNAIRKHRGGADSKPLALLCMFWLPHPPLWAPAAYTELIDPATVRMPATTGRWYGSTPVMQLANTCGQLGAHLSMDQWRAAWAMYLGMTAMLDQCVGKVLAALDHRQMLDDSMVLFASDHGEMLGGRRLFQKMCMYEPVVRTPLIIKPPGKLASLARHQHYHLTSHTDITATLLDAAGAPPVEGSPGQSLAPNLVNDTENAVSRDYVFASFDGNAGISFRHRMARSRTHKLIHNLDDQPELYDLVDDPRETRNVFTSPDHAEARDALRRRLAAWMTRTGDDAVPL